LWLFINALLVVIVLLLSYINGIALFADREMDLTEKNRLLRVTTENINEDQKRNLNKVTRLSKEDSSGKGALTKNKGVNALTPFFDFQKPSASIMTRTQDESQAKPDKLRRDQDKSEKFLSSDKGRVALSFVREAYNSSSSPTFKFSKARQSEKRKFMIPEHYRFKKDLALNISNDGKNFSFNTMKYPDYKYFQDMIKKIQKNWERNAPPGGMYMGDYNAAYYPGLSRVISFKPGSTLIVFSIDRQGKIIDIKILNRHSSRIITESCFKAIEDSREFGPLPKSIKEEYLIIPLNFIYNIL
jgi:hypothetical protein